MPKDPLQLEQMIRNEILILNRKSNNYSQYVGSSIPSHDHGNISSIPVPFSKLKGVKGYLATATTNLTSAQILTLNTTPVVLVPAPSSRSVNIVTGITARLTAGTTAYTGLHNLEFHYTNGSGTMVTDVIPPTFINSSTNAFYYAPAASNSFAPIEGGSGANGQIVAFVNTANPGAGNGTMSLIVQFRTVTFPT